ncbi:hypothetical protein JW926_06705 [Candidatus Sumerlaeota bacterium]|nr:hypothetical protein [Candidatus Sumerlaeota bacterium]
MENLVRNPDFHESGLSPWITIGSGVSLQNESFYINRASFGISGVFQDIYCLPDMDYKFSCKVKHRLYHSTNVMMRICKLDGQCNEGDIIYCRSVGTDISDWRDLEINYSTPSSSLPDEDEFIVIRLWLLMDGRGEAWFDDVKAVSKDMEARTLELVENKDKFKPLLKNGNFEEDITPSINNDLQYWNESGDCYFDTEYSVFKRGCAELSAETQSLSKITQSINIDDTNLHKYTEYFVRGHMKVQPTDTNGDVESRIKTTLINDSIPIETKTGSHVTDKESNWFRSETEVLDTGNNDSLLVECEVEKKGGNGGDAKFDAIYVFKTNYIKNSAFSHVDQGNPQKAARWDAYNGTWGNDITFANDCVSMNFGSSALGIKQTISFSNASEKYREYMLTAKAYQKYPSVADIVLLDSSDQIVTCYYQDNPDSENSWYTIKKYYYLKGDTTIKVYAKCVGGDEGIDCSFDDIRLESRSYAENGGFEYPTPTATPIPTSSATPTPTPINYGKPDQWDLWDVSHSRNVDFSQSPYEMVIRFDVSKFPITDPNNSNSTFSRIHHVNKFKCLPWQTLRIGVDIKMERVSGQYNGHPHIMVIFKDENGNNLENCHYYYRNTWPYIGSKIDTGWHEQVMIINTGHSKEFEAYLWDYEIEAGNAYGYTYFNNFRIETGFKDNKDLKLVYDPYGYVSSDSFVLETQNGSTSYKMNDMGNEAWDFEILQNIKVDEHQTYKISRDQGKITQTDIIYLASWNQSIGNTDYCMASSECRNFREFHINTLKNVLQDNGVDLKYVHLNRDELRNTQLDGRSIELGKDLGEMLQYDLSFWDQTLGQDITPIMWGDKIIHRSPEDNTYQPRILCNMKHAIDGISKRFISFSWMYYPYYPLDTRFDPPGDDNMADSFMHQCINQDIDHFERMGFSTGGTSMKWNNALAWMEFQKDWPSCIGHIDAGWDASWYIKEISTDDPEYPKVDLYWKGDISLFYDAKEIYFQTYLKRYDLFNKYTHEKWNGVPTSMDASWHPGVYHYDETQQKYLIPYDPQKMNDSYGNITNSKN